MICLIDGKRAYTDGAKVKITKENYLVKNRQTWSMNITFPMDMAENRSVFGHVDRMDVLKRRAVFSKCELYAGARLVIVGRGTVTEYTESSVKLQIRSGKEEYRYDRYAPQYYLDKLKGYADVSLFMEGHGVHAVDTLPVPTHLESLAGGGQFYGWLSGLARYSYTFLPVFDGGNGRILNQPCYKDWVTRAEYDDDAGEWRYTYAISHCLARPAVQPNLWHVVHVAIERLGYSFITTDSQAYREYSYVYIVNARQTLNIADALPHWSIQKLLDEVENLFNVTFSFDPATKECRLTDNAARSEEVEYCEASDEFTATYEQGGFKELQSSDVEYNLSDYHEYTDIPDEILEKFDVQEFNRRSLALQAFDAMSETDRMKTIFAYPQGFFTGVTEEFDEADPREPRVVPLDIGQLQHVSRSGNQEQGDDSEDTETEKVTLNLAPVHMEETEVEQGDENLEWFRGCLHAGAFSSGGNTIPVSDSPESEDADVGTVIGALEGESISEGEDAERLEIFICDPTVSVNYRPDRVNARWKPADEEFLARGTIGLPVGGTFFGSNYAYKFHYQDHPENALSLAINRDGTPMHLGRYHSAGRKIENFIQVVIRFLYDGIPDPTRLYSFRGKRYLCEKIEMELENDNILPMKTGYFYEIL